jgi:enoyl-CoA hydratase/carnithine racemase
MSTDIDVDIRSSGLACITIDRPGKHNALAAGVLHGLGEAILRVGRDVQARIILLRGAGDRYFAAGGDLVELASVRSDGQVHAMADRATRVLDAVRACEIPVVAYLNGDAIGGGAELALACDLRAFAPHARLGFIQGRMGITSAWGGGPDLGAIVGPARALRMMARCEMVDAAQALAWGLADLEATDGPEGAALSAFVMPMLERSRDVLRGIKAQCHAWRSGPGHAEWRALERASLLSTWASQAHWKAVDQFMSRNSGKEKR